MTMDLGDRSLFGGDGFLKSQVLPPFVRKQSFVQFDKGFRPLCVSLRSGHPDSPLLSRQGLSSCLVLSLQPCSFFENASSGHERFRDYKTSLSGGSAILLKQPKVRCCVRFRTKVFWRTSYCGPG
jgi:hypothetical protein